ncbi:unnamed protein product [Paramecium primaurelia]|uniref:Uncharacterized protein n=1 Tax=Paramecium primaurelia TaxID=5886 RepID=A0A8S1KBY1_PARPR|nr:unnamed protein product [Paramecium primaurelia]
MQKYLVDQIIVFFLILLVCNYEQTSGYIIAIPFKYFQWSFWSIIMKLYQYFTDLIYIHPNNIIHTQLKILFKNELSLNLERNQSISMIYNIENIFLSIYQLLRQITMINRRIN